MPQGLLKSGDGGGGGGEKSPCICLHAMCTHRQESKSQRIFQKSPQLLLEGSLLPKLIDDSGRDGGKTRTFWEFLSAFCSSLLPPTPPQLDYR